MNVMRGLDSNLNKTIEITYSGEVLPAKDPSVCELSLIFEDCDCEGRDGARLNEAVGVSRRSMLITIKNGLQLRFRTRDSVFEPCIHPPPPQQRRIQKQLLTGGRRENGRV